MPEFTGSTDETHVFSLPSEIDRVRFDRRDAPPGGLVGLEVRTLFCADGSRIQIQLVDAQGTVHDTIDGQLVGEDLNLQLRVPPEATGGLLAKVNMPNHGLSAESEAVRITDPVRVSGPRWSQETVQRCDILTLSAEARGAPDGERAVVRIFQEAPRGEAHKPVTRLRPRVENAAVEVMYQFQYPGDTEDIVPEWEAPEGYAQPRFFYTVDVLGVQADSTDAKEKGLLTFVDDLELQFVNENEAPLANQSVEITFADGSTQEKQTSGDGRLQMQGVPPGPVQIGLASYDPSTNESETEVPPSPDDATRLVMDTLEATAEVATGGEETICVVPPQIDLHLEHGLIGAEPTGTDYTLKVKTEDGSTSTLDGTVGTEGRLQQAVPVGSVAAALTLKTEGGDVTIPLDLTDLSAGEDDDGLQQRLAQVGSYGGTVDGAPGPLSTAAVQSLQAQLGTSVSGTIPDMERPMLDGLRFRDA